MNKQLEEKANKLLDLLIDGIEKGADLASSEAPKILEEYLTYFLINQYVGIAFGITLLIVSSVLMLLHFLKDFNRVVWVFIFPVFIIGMLFVFDHTQGLIQIKYAPKAYLIEKIRK